MRKLLGFRVCWSTTILATALLAGCAGCGTGGKSSASYGGGGSGTHSVDLKWSASPSAVVSYNVYRSTQAGGPYQFLHQVVDSSSGDKLYTDSNVQRGLTYYYVVTSLDSNGTESVYSNEAAAQVPNN